MQRCHQGLDPASPPTPHHAFPLFFVLEPGPSMLPAGWVFSLDTNSRVADTKSLYSECWKDSMVQGKLSGDILNRKKALLRNSASRMHGAEGAASSPALGTCIQAHPSTLQGDPLGPAPAGVILRARRGEEDPAAPWVLRRLCARADSWAQPWRQRSPTLAAAAQRRSK